MAAADITTDEGRKYLLKSHGMLIFLSIIRRGALIGHFKNWDREDWIKAINENMLTSIEMIEAVIDPMVSKKFGQIINTTSCSFKSPVLKLSLSNGVRSGLTGFAAGIAREYAQYNVTINNLLTVQFNTVRIEALIE